MASSVQLHPRNLNPGATVSNPLPQLIQTPAGLALLELQGSINFPETGDNDEGNPKEIDIGHLTFPEYNFNTPDPSNTSWMNRIHLYVGEHQRLTGEVKKLPKAMAIIRKRAKPDEDIDMADDQSKVTIEDLEIVEIVKYKLVFSSRPEPVTTV
ncbi:uncharacterized protein GGS25DRAFT_482847 [Hypoxylon fragiforme]|uniref:uncharacterized protein n=1 Tax=Hypoxylon fragiforme TaxID=63214 RepID=UPI0020C6F30D|nr:uncharacterized protein GGS25DRAFT_482847 [Hypoxylon fragiforme]KAI2611467.1 hypothetical protein GGS25DRAFT_482847 [Hypoxylon fragiforme]